MLGEMYMDDESIELMMDQIDERLSTAAEIPTTTVAKQQLSKMISEEQQKSEKSSEKSSENEQNADIVDTTSSPSSEVKQHEETDVFERPTLKVLDLRVTLIDDSQLPDVIAPNQKYDMKIKVHMEASSSCTYQLRVCRPDSTPSDPVLELVERRELTGKFLRNFFLSVFFFKFLDSLEANNKMNERIGTAVNKKQRMNWNKKRHENKKFTQLCLHRASTASISTRDKPMTVPSSSKSSSCTKSRQPSCSWPV